MESQNSDLNVVASMNWKGLAVKVFGWLVVMFGLSITCEIVHFGWHASAYTTIMSVVFTIIALRESFAALKAAHAKAVPRIKAYVYACLGSAFGMYGAVFADQWISFGGWSAFTGIMVALWQFYQLRRLATMSEGDKFFVMVLLAISAIACLAAGIVVIGGLLWLFAQFK